MSRITLLVLSVMVCVSAGFYFYHGNDRSSAVTTVAEQDIEGVVPIKNNRHAGAVAVSPAPESVPSSAIDRQALPNQDHHEEAVATEVWSVSTDARDYYLSRPEELVVDINAEEYLQIQTQKIAAMQVGDEMALLVPQLGVSYDAKVDKVTTHANGDVTVESEFEGEDKLFASIITVGKDETFGTLITPYGDYMMRAKGEYAWIASRSDLEKKHDATHKDYVIPQVFETEDVLNNPKETVNDEIEIIY